MRATKSVSGPRSLGYERAPTCLPKGGQTSRSRCVSSRRLPRKIFETAIRSTRRRSTKSRATLHQRRSANSRKRKQLALGRPARLSRVARRAHGEFPRRRVRGGTKTVRVVPPPRLAAAVRFDRNCGDRTSRAGPRSRPGSVGGRARRAIALALARADVCDEAGVLRILRAESRKTDRVHRLASDRNYTVVYRSVPYRRSAQSSRSDLSGRLHESSVDARHGSPRFLFCA